MESHIEKFKCTLIEYFEYCSELMDDGCEGGFFETDGRYIRGALIVIKAWEGDYLIKKFLESHEFWIDCDTKELSFFEKDFSEMLKGSKLNMNSLKAPIQKYIDYNNGELDSCPFDQEHVELVWDYLHALIKHSHNHLKEKKEDYVPGYPLDNVEVRFKI